jgi:Uma2 family endonuclease
VVSKSLRYTSADLDCLPDVEGKRYEIIDGELYVSKQPQWEHQFVCGRLNAELDTWNIQTGIGLAIPAPGLIFAPDDDVAPDLVWASRARLASIRDDRGHFRAAPELVIEVLSPGATNERRDRELKLKLYSRQGVHEYWIVDWRLHSVQVYRREQAELRLMRTLDGDDALSSPLLPGFTCPLARLWAPSFPSTME